METAPYHGCAAKNVARDRQVDITNAVGDVTSTVYDAAGRVVVDVNARSQRTTHTWNGANREAHRAYPDGDRYTWGT